MSAVDDLARQAQQVLARTIQAPHATGWDLIHMPCGCCPGWVFHNTDGVIIGCISREGTLWMASNRISWVLTPTRQAAMALIEEVR